MFWIPIHYISGFQREGREKDTCLVGLLGNLRRMSLIVGRPEGSVASLVRRVA